MKYPELLECDRTIPAGLMVSSDISLRDIFAGLAMGAQVSSRGLTGFLVELASNCAAAYKVADAMLKAREVK